MTLAHAALALALLAPISAAATAETYSAADVDRLAVALDASSRKIATEVDDDTIARDVGRDIVYGLGTEITGLFVTSTNGVVTLKGTVESADTRDRAIARARRVSGVRSVVPLLTTPGEPAPAEAAPLAAAPSATPEPIDFVTLGGLAGRGVLVVDDAGTLTLTGRVNNARAHKLVVAAAMRIDGARSIDDQLEIVRHSRQNDRNLAEIVRFRLGEVPSLRDAIREDVRPTIERLGDLVEIHVEDGVAVLHGRVPTETVRRAMVARTAATSGVFAVQDRLEVDGDVRTIARDRPAVDIFGAAFR